MQSLLHHDVTQSGTALAHRLGPAHCRGLKDTSVWQLPRHSTMRQLARWQAVKDTAELRSAVEEVQPERVKLSLRLSQSRALYDGFQVS